MASLALWAIHLLPLPRHSPINHLFCGYDMGYDLHGIRCFSICVSVYTAGEGTPPYGNCLIQSAELISCQPDKTDAQCAPLQYFTWYSIINRPEHRICFLPTIIRKPSADCKAKILPLSPLRFSLRSYIIILVNERCVVLCPNRTVFWQ